MVEPSTMDPNKGIWMWGKEANGEDTFLCTRIPMRRTAELFKHHQGWQETIRKALGVKPCVKRGAARNGMSRSYIQFGWRKEPKGKGIGQYSFKKNTSAMDKDETNTNISKMVGLIEGAAAKFIHPNELMRLCTLHKACNVAFVAESQSTQFSIGMNYWSAAHDDEDWWWTILSVLDIEDTSHSIIHWFVFPEFGAAVPMCAGDVLIFNPRVLHSCTNGTRDGSLIFSAYVSGKTVATCTASELEK